MAATDDQPPRLVVELGRLARADLAWCCEAEEANKTTVVNRAIRIYRLVMEAQSDGKRLTLIDTGTGEGEAIRIV